MKLKDILRGLKESKLWPGFLANFEIIGPTERFFPIGICTLFLETAGWPSKSSNYGTRDSGISNQRIRLTGQI